tara:strand:+ start:996 stop:1250 length:255 start_codon:yes stop_codon:yes gene_type:complete
MKRGTTTPLPPSYPTASDGTKPEYHDIIDIIDKIWLEIAQIEIQIRKNPNIGLGRQLEYYYNLSDYWENVYLCLMGMRFYEQFL